MHRRDRLSQVVIPRRQLYWFRSRASVRQDPDFQKVCRGHQPVIPVLLTDISDVQCVLAYASDLNFIGTAARATGLGSNTSPRLGMLAVRAFRILYSGHR